LTLGKDGSPIVLIVGGNERGMEAWNPGTSTVELLSDEILPEKLQDYAISVGEMIPIKEGSEFIYYGGWHGSTTDEIWKYVVESQKWTR